MTESALSCREKLATIGFGPTGFESVVYALLILNRVANGNQLFELIAIVVAVSIVAHSSTDIVIARWLAPEDGERDEKFVSE